MIGVLLVVVVPLVVQAQECCMPEQLETFSGISFGYTDRNVPDFEPQTISGLVRIVYDYTGQRQLTRYDEYVIPGQEGLVSILGDYSHSPLGGRFYRTYQNGSCFYEDFEFVLMTPPCFDSIFPLLGEYTLGPDIPAASYGDVTLDNYVVVQLPDCFPLINIATRRNLPEEGIYRFESQGFINTTVGISDPSELDPPTDCQPLTISTGQIPVGFLVSEELKGK